MAGLSLSREEASLSGKVTNHKLMKSSCGFCVLVNFKLQVPTHLHCRGQTKKLAAGFWWQPCMAAYEPACCWFKLLTKQLHHGSKDQSNWCLKTWQPWTMSQSYQPATCLLRNTTGSICSAGGGWLGPFFTVCVLWPLGIGVLFFTVVELEAGAVGGLRPAALAKKALDVSHDGSCEKENKIDCCKENMYINYHITHRPFAT